MKNARVETGVFVAKAGFSPRCFFGPSGLTVLSARDKPRLEAWA
jgi:hypothetical protein